MRTLTKPLTAIATTAAIAALTLTGTAHAQTTTTHLSRTTITFSITPGGSATGTAGTTTFRDINTGSLISCEHAMMLISLLKGHGINPKKLAIINELLAENCTFFNLPVTVRVTPPLTLSGTSYHAGITSGSISGIKASLSIPNCNAQLAGPSPAIAGRVQVTYTNTTGMLKVLTTGGNLHLWNVSGCAGTFNNGDAMSITSSLTISPKQTITSP